MRFNTPFLKSSAATSLATLDDFVPVMLEAEDENYNLFEVINELNREVGVTNVKVCSSTGLPLQRNHDNYKSEV